MNHRRRRRWLFLLRQSRNKGVMVMDGIYCINIVCCVCHTLIAYRPCKKKDHGMVSHTYCKACFEKAMLEIENA